MVKVWREANEKTGGAVTAKVLRKLTEACVTAEAVQRNGGGRHKVLEELGLRLAPRSWGDWKPVRSAQVPVSRIPAALATHDRAREVSEEIKLVLGPWSAEGDLPERRRLPESASVIGWRKRLEQNGSKPPSPASLERVIAEIEKVRNSLPTTAKPHLDEAIAALERAARVPA